MTLFFTLFFVVCSCYVIKSDAKSKRLPTDIIPNIYQIRIHPDINEATFKGSEIISLRNYDHVKQIQLHSRNLDISEVSLDYNGDTQYELVPEDEVLIVSLPDNETIFAGEHILRISFNGSLECDKPLGFCKILYLIDGESRYLLVSDFEPTYARTSFPCFDEPHFKAKFNVRIISPNDTFVALSNMDEISKFKTSDGIAYTFASSPLMSTYMVTFVLTDYPYVESIWNNSGILTPIRAYSPFNVGREKLFALETAKRFLEYFQNYTGMVYNLRKLDMIEYERITAASENWGMITLKERLLSNKKSPYSKATIAEVIAHEVAHVWFGNYVTNYWWNDIWLQEGVAQFFAKKALYELFDTELFIGPKPDISRKLLFNDRNNSMPVIIQLSETVDIEKQFEGMIYVKGSKIVETLEAVVGEERFRQSMRKFLTIFKYKSVTTNDFISVIEDFAPEINVRGYLETWLYQNRYPIVFAKQGDNNNTFVLTQDSFAVNKGADKPNSLNYKWTIPLMYITNNNATPTVAWFDKEQESITLEVPNTRWIMFNPSHVGLYRFNYTEEMLASLMYNLDELELEQRHMLYLELYHLFGSGYIHCGPILDFIDNYRTEKSKDIFFCFYFLNQLKIYLLKNNPELLPRYYKFIKQVALRNNKFIPEHYFIMRFTDLKRPTVDQIMDNPKVRETMPSCINWIKEHL